MRRNDICRERHWLRQNYIIRTEERNARLARLNTVVDALVCEKVSIHHYGDTHIKGGDCPLIKDVLSTPTRAVYGWYGCEGCDYYGGEELSYVKCKRKAALELRRLIDIMWGPKGDNVWGERKDYEDV